MSQDSVTDVTPASDGENGEESGAASPEHAAAASGAGTAESAPTEGSTGHAPRGMSGLLAGAGGHVRHVVIGFCMGSAEVVPGVSGGTVALVGGIYTRLVDSVRDGANAGLTLARGRIGEGWDRLRKLDWAFLIPLGVGMVVAIVTLARVVTHYLEEEPVRIAGLFLGLVLGSLVVALQLIRRVDKVALLIIVGVGLAMFVLLGLHQETTGESGEVASASLWAYPLAASVAICAWILPGISGSLMLVMMGMYADVTGALNDRDLPPLLLFGVGAVIGLALFSRLLAWLMDHHHDRMLAAMIGLMLGSTRVLWPWPGGVDSTELGAPRSDVAVPVVLALIGLAVVVGVARLGVLGREEEAATTG